MIGGSISGLLAAQVLTAYFDRVTIVERDQLPTEAQQRKGTPQARHVHVLLTRGQQIITHLFPGITDELVAAGAPRVDWTGDCVMYGQAGQYPRFYSGLVSYTCSRNLLEYVIRRRLAANPQIHWYTGSDACGLIGDQSHSGISGVMVYSRSTAAREALYGDLIVDASGRNSRTPEWLTQLGYPRPEETIVDTFQGYASRWYQCPPSFQSNWKVLFLRNSLASQTRGGVIYPIEGNRWVVTLGGSNRDYPPTDEANFLAFARSLSCPDFYAAILEAEPISPIYGYQRTENHMRHYERMDRWPDNFVALGDSVCALNPIYGHGMTMAALGAQTLGECLNEQRQIQPSGSLKGMASRFQQQQARVNTVPWMMATSETGVAETAPNLRQRAMRWYMNQVKRRAINDPFIYQTFVEVSHLLKPPTALFQPQVALRVLGHHLEPRASAAALLLPHVDRRLA